MTIISAIGLTILFAGIASILYRMGGSGNFSRKYRELGVPAMFVALIAVLGAIRGIWQAVALIPCFGLMVGAISSYRYFLPKPKDYNAFYYALHGFMVALSAFPLIIFTHYWIGFSIRCIVCAIGMGLWSKYISNDVIEECGRGAIIILTTPLLLI